LEKPFTKKGWWSGLDVGPEFKPQYCRKKKKLKSIVFTDMTHHIFPSFFTVVVVLGLPAF
jgi:hypothetical protein